ncbi:MAG: hypothetical protein RL454_347 [Actinomycetota bacterium]
MLRRLIRSNDRGLTLVEVVVGTVITALISITLFRLGSDASIGLERSVDRSVAQVQLGNYAQLLRSDIGLSSAVTVYTASAPSYVDGDTSNTAALCGTWLTAHNAATWTDGSKVGFVRTLFSLKQSIIDTTSATYVDPTVRWVGYEVHGEAGKDAAGTSVTNYSLWRISCTETAGVVDLPGYGSAQKLVDFGVNFNQTAAGDTTLFCDSTGTASCATSGTSGINPNSGVTAFTFKLPFQDVKQLAAGSGGKGSLTIRDAAFANTLTNNMQRKIG